MIDRKTWLPQAQALPEGKSARIGHNCGAGECMRIWHRQDGWSAYCHRCPDGFNKDFVPRPAESLSEKLARLNRAQQADEEAKWNRELPNGETDPQKWPLAARVWLYKAGLSNGDIKSLGIRWSGRIRRVVIPLYEGDELVYWQARNVDQDDRPKYINPNVTRDRLLYKAGSGNHLVLTEDILSAYKVASAGFRSWALMGTKLNAYLTNEILRFAQGSNVRLSVWLDPDEAGQAAARKITGTLRAYGAHVVNIVRERDPKLYSRSDIEGVLNGRNTSAEGGA